VPYPRARDDFTSVGFDDFTAVNGRDQLFSPHSTGLLCPTIVTGFPFLFLGQTLDLVAGDSLVGMRELVTIARVFPVAGGVTWPVERTVVTPGWHLPGGWATFSLTSEPTTAPCRRQGPQDGPSCAFRDATGPAFLYEALSVPALPGRPGYLGMDGVTYTPPPMIGTVEYEVRDVQDPWEGQTWGKLDLPVDRPTRFRAYIQVMQVNVTPPVLAGILPTDVRLTGLVEEDRYWQLGGSTVGYWRVGVALKVKTRAGAEREVLVS